MIVKKFQLKSHTQNLMVHLQAFFFRINILIHEKMITDLNNKPIKKIFFLLCCYLFINPSVNNENLFYV